MNRILKFLKLKKNESQLFRSDLFPIFTAFLLYHIFRSIADLFIHTKYNEMVLLLILAFMQVNNAVYAKFYMDKNNDGHMGRSRFFLTMASSLLTVLIISLIPDVIIQQETVKEIHSTLEILKTFGYSKVISSIICIIWLLSQVWNFISFPNPYTKKQLIYPCILLILLCFSVFCNSCIVINIISLAYLIFFIFIVKPRIFMKKAIGAAAYSDLNPILDICKEVSLKQESFNHVESTSNNGFLFSDYDENVRYFHENYEKDIKYFTIIKDSNSIIGFTYATPASEATNTFIKEDNCNNYTFKDLSEKKHYIENSNIESIYYLKIIAVRKAYAKKGVAKQLLSEVEDTLKNKGIKYIYTDIIIELFKTEEENNKIKNKPSIKFFIKNGYYPIGISENYTYEYSPWGRMALFKEIILVKEL